MRMSPPASNDSDSARHRTHRPIRGRKHDARGRSTSERIRKAKLKVGPSYCLEKNEGWAWFSLELLESVAFCALGINARRALMRIVIEHIHHGLQENGALVVTHDNFYQYGIPKDAIAPALWEVRHFGLIRYHKGRGGHGIPWPTRFRLTWIGDWDGNPPTNDWKGTSEADVASWKARRKKLMAIQGRERRRTRQAKKSPNPTCREHPTPTGRGTAVCRKKLKRENDGKSRIPQNPTCRGTL